MNTPSGGRWFRSRTDRTTYRATSALAARSGGPARRFSQRPTKGGGGRQRRAPSGTDTGEDSGVPARPLADVEAVAVVDRRVGPGLAVDLRGSCAAPPHLSGVADGGVVVGGTELHQRVGGVGVRFQPAALGWLAEQALAHVLRRQEGAGELEAAGHEVEVDPREIGGVVGQAGI